MLIMQFPFMEFVLLAFLYQIFLFYQIGAFLAPKLIMFSLFNQSKLPQKLLGYFPQNFFKMSFRKFAQKVC